MLTASYRFSLREGLKCSFSLTVSVKFPAATERVCHQQMHSGPRTPSADLTVSVTLRQNETFLSYLCITRDRFRLGASQQWFPAAAD